MEIPDPGPLFGLPKKRPESWRRSIFSWKRREYFKVIRARINYFEWELGLVDLPEPGGLPPAPRKPAEPTYLY